MPNPPSPPRPATLGILIFDDVEVLDFCGPFEVFSSARGDRGERLFRVVTVAARREPISCRGGLRVVPDFTVDDHPPLALVLVPGGAGTDAAERDPALLGWVRQASAAATLTMSVCTGAFVLAAAGLLDGAPATTWFRRLDDLAARYPAIDVRRDRRYVDAGRVATAAGVSAGIDLALHAVGRLHGAACAAAVAEEMEYRGGGDG